MRSLSSYEDLHVSCVRPRPANPLQARGPSLVAGGHPDVGLPHGRRPGEAHWLVVVAESCVESQLYAAEAVLPCCVLSAVSARRTEKV